MLFYLVLHSPRGGTQLMLITGRLRAELQPLPFYVQKRYHFRVLTNGTPFTYLGIPRAASLLTVNVLSFKYNYYSFQIFPQF